MPSVRGCQLPDELLYDVENNIWYRENADGTVTLGMTAVAAAMAGQLVAFTKPVVNRLCYPRQRLQALLPCRGLGNS